MKKKVFEFGLFRTLIIFMVIIASIGLFLPYETSTEHHRKWLEKHPENVYIKEIDMTNKEALEISIVENFRIYIAATSEDTGTDYNNEWLHGEAIINIVITVALILSIFMLLLGAIFRKYILSFIFNLIMIGSSLLMNYDIGLRGVLPSRKYNCGISYYLYIILGVILVVLIIMAIIEKKKVKSGKNSLAANNSDLEIVENKSDESEDTLMEKENKRKLYVVLGIVGIIVALVIVFAIAFNLGKGYNKSDKNESRISEETTVEIAETTLGEEAQTVDLSDKDSIITNAENSINAEITSLTTEWEGLKKQITSYGTYVTNKEKVEAFYNKVVETNKKVCTMGYQAALDYANAIENSNEEYKEKYDMAKDINKEIYDDMFDSIQDALYEDLFDDLQKHMYEGVLDDQDESGVEYDDWYDTRSNEYDEWYDSRSDIYDEWYDSRSDVYDFYYDLSSELYDEDKDGVAKEIGKFKERIEKRK